MVAAETAGFGKEDGGLRQFDRRMRAAYQELSIRCRQDFGCRPNERKRLVAKAGWIWYFSVYGGVESRFYEMPRKKWRLVY